MPLIKPTPGRIVWFYADKDDAPLAAIVAKVWHDRHVNLGVFDENGATFPITDVPLVQEGDALPAAHAFCAWMPYQQALATKAAAIAATAEQQGGTNVA